MVTGLEVWYFRKDGSAFDPHTVYADHPEVFSMKLFHGGTFTPTPNRRYFGGKVQYIDLLDIEQFTITIIHSIVKMLKYDTRDIMYYHFKIPDKNLDWGLRALASDDDIVYLSKFVKDNKVIEVYIEHGETTVESYYMPTFTEKLQLKELNNNDEVVELDEELPIVPHTRKRKFLGIPKCRKTLAIEWLSNDQVGEHSGLGGAENASGEDNAASGDENYATADENDVMAALRSERKKGNADNESVIVNHFFLGQEFGNREEVKERIKAYSVESRRNVEIVKNDNVRVSARYVGIVPSMDDGTMESSIGKRSDKAKKGKNVILEMVDDKYKCQWSVAKAKAEETLKGDAELQYGMLRDYVMELQKCNPNTTVKIDVYRDEDADSNTKKFRRIYVCLGALKDGFKAGGRDLIGLDGAFMKAPYEGQLLTAVSVDANNGIYPVAYGIVESESLDSWLWFLSALGDDLDLHINSNFTFITDRQKGLLPAIKRLFPSAEHRYCVRHICENMNLTWRGGAYKEMLWNCATATTITQFNRGMEVLKSYNINAYEWLQKIPAEHWSRSHFSGRAHCDLLINNICEVFNRQLLDARNSPIITCLEYEKATQYNVDWNGGDLYQVKGPYDDQVVVNLKQRICSCRKWEVSGLPCKHAVACINNMNENGLNGGLPENWVHASYRLQTWKEQYTFKINPIAGRDYWEKREWPSILIPPKPHPKIGRPPKKRKKSVVELDELVRGIKLSKKGSTVTCSNCKGKGHNKRGCKASAGGRAAGASGSQATSVTATQQEPATSQQGAAATQGAASSASPFKRTKSTACRLTVY
ncbi:mutator type transposase [Tanacetum coccineum]